MKFLRQLSLLTLSLLLVSALIFSAGAEGEECETTVLFTHDLHSHFLPQKTEDGGESGGYARLMSALEREREKHPDALTLDGGDFSVGSLIQTLSTSQAAELRTMGAMGYDAATVGNHEFDGAGPGFAKMLNTAALSGDPVPALLMANYKPAQDNPDKLDIQRAMAAYGVKDYLLLERGGVTYGIFGLMGEESDSMAPTSGFALEDPAAAAQRCVDALRGQGAQFIICLSHSGTNEKRSASEDEQLAQAVEGIDLIVSGHSHTTLEEPIVVGDTYIVSAGPYCENLGSVTIAWDEAGEKTLVDYHLTSIDETLPEDETIAGMVESWKKLVTTSYLSAYDLTYDQVLTTSAFDLPLPEQGVQEENSLGDLAADAYLWAAEHLEADSPNVETVAVTASGILRAPLYAGDITVSQAFDVLSMGQGEDGTAGYPLVSCYLTGKELKAVLEVDASVTPLMPEAQLYLSGIQYSFNVHRMLFNRVTEAELKEPLFADESGAQGLAQLENDKLYRVVSGMYCAQMLSTVKEKSFGLLSIVPKDENGQEITDFNTRILRSASGSEIKEWYALAAYLRSFGEEGVPGAYAFGDGRKDVSRSWNPIELLKHPNWITLAAVFLLVVLAAAVVLLVRGLVRLRRNRRYGGGYRPRRRFGR